MRNKAWITVVIMIFLISGCTFQSNSGLLKEGKYVLNDNQEVDWAWVILESNNHFEFNRGLATSYRPSGTYRVEEDILILEVNDDEMYRFTIDGNRLIFLDSKQENTLIEKGEIFEYSDED